MEIVLQGHKAKPICDVPKGLSELCSDISREVIRYEPEDIYCFVADYLDALLITRENAKVAVQVVQNVVMKTEVIIEILGMTGLRLEEIASAMPRLRCAFRSYLETLDSQKKTCGCDVDSDVGEECEMTICDILRQTGASYAQIKSAATKIQAAFRGHYERMQMTEGRGEVSWQRAAVRTVEILRRCGVTRKEASRAATVIQAVYRGYYVRRNVKLREARKKLAGLKEPFDGKAWMKMMFERKGLTVEAADRAARIIQAAYRGYVFRKPTTSARMGSTSILGDDDAFTSDDDADRAKEWSFQTTTTTRTSLLDLSDILGESEDGSHVYPAVKFNQQDETNKDEKAPSQAEGSPSQAGEAQIQVESQVEASQSQIDGAPSGAQTPASESQVNVEEDEAVKEE